MSDDERAPDSPAPNEEYDAFNDDTFGQGAAEDWEESQHEQLAQMTEEERRAIKASADFFDLDGADDGEELGGALEDDGDELAAAEESSGERVGGANGLAAASAALHRAVMAPRQTDERPTNMGGQAMLASELETRMRLEEASGPPDDPAILGVSRGNQHRPPPLSGQTPPLPQMPPSMPPNMSLPPGMTPAQAYAIQAAMLARAGGSGGRNERSFPPRGYPSHLPPPPFAGGHLPPHPQRPPPMGFPGFPPPPDMRAGGARELEMAAERERQQRMLAMHHHHHQQQQQRQHRPFDNHQQQQYAHGGHRQPRQQQYHHQQQGYHSRQQGYNNRNRIDDRNRETFGDDFVDSMESEDHLQRRHHDRGHGGGHGGGGLITPGHVHTLGILRNARGRRYNRTIYH
jgi:hypothetical protein